MSLRARIVARARPASRETRRLARIIGASVAIALAPPATVAASYPEHRAAAVARCEAIDPGAYQANLLFNPDGYRSYFLRSECFQRVATEFRDAALCSQVRQRPSLLVSSWGYSPSQCLGSESDASPAVLSRGRW